MNFKYSDIANSYIPSAYERLLLDAMQGDASLFIRSDSVEATWRFLAPLLNVIQTNPIFNLYSYLPCTWGPSEANNLIPGGWHRYENYCKVDDNDDQPLPFTIST